MARVSMKSMFFAFMGVVLSMVLTAAWMDEDLDRIRAKQAAERAAQCAAQQARASQSTQPQDDQSWSSQEEPLRPVEPVQEQQQPDCAQAPAAAASEPVVEPLSTQ